MCLKKCENETIHYKFLSAAA